METLSLIASLVAAACSVATLVQNLKVRKPRFAFSVEREDVPCPREGQGADWTVACKNDGLAAAKVVDLLLVIPGKGSFSVKSSLQGRDNALPKLVTPGDGFELWFAESKVVGGEGIPKTAFFRVVLFGGARYDSAPLDELLGQLRVDEESLAAESERASAVGG